jgi:hypothetical protein
MSIFHGLFHGRRDFVGAAVAPGNLSARVANNDERIEAESAAAFHDRGASPDRDDAFAPLAAPVTISIAVPTFTCHVSPRFPRSVRLRLDCVRFDLGF